MNDPGAEPDDECYLLPTSFGQERLWLLDRIAAGEAHHMPGALRLEGDLDPDALARAFAGLADRHEVLRSTIELGLDGTLGQVIHPRMDIPIERVDASAGDGGQDAQARRLVDLLGAPFDLATGPLIRVVLMRLPGQRTWLLGVTMHHIVSDGWSVGVLMNELTALYRAELTGATASLPALPIQYGDFAAWQRERFAHADPALLEYWRDNLAGAQPVEPVGRDWLAAGSATTESLPLALAPATTRAMRALAKQEAATPFMVLVAAYAAVLARLTEQDDVVVGTPVAGRDRPELSGLIGFFVNTLPLRVAVDGAASFRDLVRRAREVCLGAFAHQEVPFEHIIGQCQLDRAPGRPPLVTAMIALQNMPAPVWRLPGVRAAHVDLPVVSTQFPVTLDLEESADGAISGRLHHWLRDWSRADARLLASAWHTLLAVGVADPDRPVGLLPLEPATGGTGTAVGPPPVASGCAHHLIEDAARAFPERIAVTASPRQLTYRELDDRAARLARRLRAAGAEPDRLVAICLPRSAAQVIAVVAVLKAEAAYLPVDHVQPRARIELLLADAAPAVILTDRATAATGLLDDPPGPDRPAVLVVDAEPEPPEPDGPLPAAASDGARGAMLAYAVPTSGSTGTPKGAMNTHDAIVNRVCELQERLPLGPGGSVLYKSPVSFDAAALELLWPLTAGGRVVVADEDGHRDPGYLARLISAESVTAAVFVPSMLQAFLGEPDATRCDAALRTVVCGGEELSPTLARRFFQVLPGAQLYNNYGPAEAAVYVTAHRVVPADLEGCRIPIGHPSPGVRLRVLDRRGQPVPRGAPGELHIAGTAVGRGYLGRPGLTADRYIPDALAGDGSRLYRTGDRVRQLPGGEFDFLGRYDRQLKVRGVRVEPGEIEAVLGEHPEVEQAVVIPAGGDGADRQLVAYVAYRDRAPEPAELRGFLLGRLPFALVPDAFVVLSRLPVTRNGKLGRDAPPEPWARQESWARREPPRTPAEQVLAGIWAEVLGLPEVGVRDNFYALGGNSLRAVAVLQKAQQAGLLPSLELMLSDHTIEQLAARLGTDPGEGVRDIGRLLS